ncbi:unnamed protein product [Adineta steineri]|uniref:Uncharacterized protein n=1 Tax=Adineta steineri TaxID=433720 RepID=A0A814E0A6_9BILA|nr:unnamed protein product [Adineta steineri]
MPRRTQNDERDEDENKKHDDDFYGGQRKQETDLGGSGKSLWDAARDIVASREQAETLPTVSNTVLFVGSRSGVK